MLYIRTIAWRFSQRWHVSDEPQATKRNIFCCCRDQQDTCLAVPSTGITGNAIYNKKLRYRWQTVRRFYRSVKVTKHGTIPYVRYGFLLVCYSNSVPKMHHFSHIQLQKCCDLENRVKSPWKSLEMSPFDRAYDFLLMFYSNHGSISYRFWDIQCQKILQPWNPSQEPIKVIESGTIR